MSVHTAIFSQRVATFIALGALIWCAQSPISATARQQSTTTLQQSTTAQQRVDFRASTRVRYDSDDYGSDVDLDQYLSLNVYDIIEDHLSLRLYGWYNFDLNGDDEIDRAYEDSRLKLHQAVFDFYDYGALSHLRLGRQYLPEVDYVYFDGAYVSLFEDNKADVFAFAGRPVSHYSANASEWLVGGGVRLRPWPSTEIQTDIFGIADRGEDVMASALRWRQNFRSGFGNRVEGRWLDSQFRDLLTQARYYSARHQYDVTGEFFWQAERLGNNDETYANRLFSPYATLMGPAEEFIDLSLNANKYLGDHYTLSLGSRYHRITRRDREGGENFTNIDSRHFYGGVFVADLPTTGMELGLFGNYFDNPEESYFDVTGEIGYKFNKDFRISTGASYSRYNLYERLYFQDVNGDYLNARGYDRVDSRIYFVEARCKLSKALRLVAQAEYEDSDGNDHGAYSVRVRLDYFFRTPRKIAKPSPSSAIAGNAGANTAEAAGK